MQCELSGPIIEHGSGDKPVACVLAGKHRFKPLGKTGGEAGATNSPHRSLIPIRGPCWRKTRISEMNCTWGRTREHYLEHVTVATRIVISTANVYSAQKYTMTV